MLLELQILNFAIIEKLKITFENGLTVFTGETGAGKSIIIDAIALLAGGRGSSEYVRHGTKKAEIEGLFEINDHHEVLQLLDNLGIDKNEDMIILKREISEKGKSICRVNGKLVTLASLHEIGQKLIDIHGQHEHQLLLDPERHLPLIDQFGGDRIAGPMSAYREEYRKTAELAGQCAKFNKNEKQIAQRVDLLQFQIKEIGNAQLKQDEEAQLLEEKRKLVNFEKVFQALKTGYEALDGENKGLDWLRRAAGELQSVQDLDKELKEFYESVSGSYYVIEEQASSIRNYLETMEYTPDRLDDIELRLNDIHLLKRKYGANIKEILDYYTKIEKEYDDLTHRDEKYDKLNEAFSVHLDKLRKKALTVSAARKKTIAQLTRSVNHELKDLYMEHARFDVRFEQQDALDTFDSYQADGIDRAEFYITTNPGEPLKPLAKIASGGELSRIMLAIKSNFKQVIGLTSIIFDEVDTGVSGRVAQAMAEKIFSLSKSSQVFCITHLPQIAAMADQHLYIAKHVTENNRTKTTVKKLSSPEKIREIGRMISGTKVTDLTKKHAEELLKMAEKVKI
ncbi:MULTISPECIES: DNA repair protein RecN [unclassified Sporolactobacillus]|uniref:DNA repair protein RecN n=1 Tax=unclassified Sporolactobacillus TaxID=2628533 RepID=UPI0023675D1F|nr:DNA repair protein RecN [Sporolactobacillus sp. CQH2019]MDD9149309.1 DNA repair protein RecN [Sporolactobacillus sp. CQH2019]